MSRLLAWRLEARTLVDALDLAIGFLGAGSVVFLSTPARFVIGRASEQGGWLDDGGGDVSSVADTYEMRAFGPAGEVRWHHDEAGTGAVCLVGPQAPAEMPSDAQDVSVSFVTTLPATSVVWGGIDEVSGRWVTLQDGRVGRLSVPVVDVGAKGGSVMLTSTEYIAVDDHGNAYVTEELLHGFERRVGMAG